MHRTIDTADGPFSIVASDGAVLAAGWTDDVASLVALIHPSLRAAAGPASSSGIMTTTAAAAPNGVLDDAVASVHAYYGGDHHAPSAIPVSQASGEFRAHAWDVLRGVGPGERLTYTEYATRAGRPAAVRAAAGACAMNAAALFVPCHRVLRTDGTLGGFRYGLDVKRSLLARERAAS